MLKKIKIINLETSKILEVSIVLYKINNEFFIELRYEKFPPKFFISSNYYNSFVEMRSWLLEEQLGFPMVKGSLLYVYPSRMTLQMSGGLKAYSLIMGKQSNEEDIVDIFDSIDIDQSNYLSSRLEQEKYFKKWLNSL